MTIVSGLRITDAGLLGGFKKFDCAAIPSSTILLPPTSNIIYTAQPAIGRVMGV